MNKIYSGLLTAAVLAALLVHGAYLYELGSPQLSASSEEWANFGDYVGGTLGTYFSFFAFIGVVATLMLQQRQLEQIQRQAKLDEIQRYLAYASSKVDALLQQQPRTAPEALERMLRGKAAPASLHNMLFAAVNLRLSENTGMQPQAAALALRDLVKSLRFETAPLIVELHQLATGLDSYARQGGSIEIIALYHNRYRAETGALQLLDILSSETVVRSFAAKDASAELERNWRETPQGNRSEQR
jgi:hypothetical protein